MTAPAGPDGTSGSGRESAFGLLNLALDHITLLVAVPVAAAVLAFAFATIRGPEYTASAAIVPESRGPSLGELGGLAATLGFAGSLGQQDESVDFYARLAVSRALLEEVAARTYTFRTRGGESLEGTIPELLDIEEDTPEEELRVAVEVLGDRVEAEADRNAGMVHVRTTAPWRELSVLLNRAVLESMDRFNLEKRQSSAKAEREFAERQLEETRADLRAAEQELQRFLENNRRYQNLPELRFEASRLERQVDLVQQLYTSLAQSLQSARLEEVRATPTITVISPPENSALKATSRLRTAILGFLLGLALVIAYLYLHEYAARQRALAPEEYEGFRARRRRLLRR